MSEIRKGFEIVRSEVTADQYMLASGTVTPNPFLEASA